MTVKRKSEMKISAAVGVALLLLLVQCATAQDVNFRGPVVYAEIGGAGGPGISLNVEHEILYKSNWFLNARIGYGAANIAGVHTNSLPVGISFFHGERKSHIEVGAVMSYAEGRQYYFDHGPLSKALYFVPSLSYRLQKPSGGFFLRIGYTPWIKLKEYTEFFHDVRFGHYFGISLGYYFNRTQKRPTNK